MNQQIISLSKAQEKEFEQLPTKSAKIRYLHSLGFARGQIAKKLDIKYQHVRNVLITPIKSERK